MEFLNKLLNEIERHPKTTVYFVVSGFVVPIFLVQILYSIPSIIPRFNSPLSAGDLLGFYAAFIATAGTVFLGFIAFKQNQIINKQSIALQKLDEERQIKAVKPYLNCVKVTNFSAENRIAIVVENQSKNDAYNVVIDRVVFYNMNFVNLLENVHNLRERGSPPTLECELIHQYIHNYTSNTFNLAYKSELLIAQSIAFRLTFKDILGKKYTKLVYSSLDGNKINISQD